MLEMNSSDIVFGFLFYNVDYLCSQCEHFFFQSGTESQSVRFPLLHRAPVQSQQRCTSLQLTYLVAIQLIRHTTYCVF